MEKNLKERDLPYRVSYDFTIQNHVHKHDDELYINGPLTTPPLFLSSALKIMLDNLA